MNQLTGTIGAALASLLTTGCYTAQVDLTLGGVFACTQKADDCPDGLTCVNGVCEDEVELPTIEILLPEDEFVFVTDAPDVPGGPMPPPLELEIRVQGELELVAANSGAEHEYGEGHVVVYVDDVEQATIDTGDIESSALIVTQIEKRAGPHRITAQAVRNDGIPYDNEESTGMRLFWIESELIRGMRPFVAVKSPWPGSTHPLDEAEIEVEIATLNFEMVPPATGAVDGAGHAHVYYDTDQPFPDCLMNPTCDSDYITVVADPPSIEVELPDASVGSADLSAVLRQVGHDQYRFPFGCDPMIDLVCQPVHDTITINRADR